MSYIRNSCLIHMECSIDNLNSLHELNDFDMSRRRQQGNTAGHRQRQAERQHQKKVYSF